MSTTRKKAARPEVTGLQALARQVGINAFWQQWDEAGHFELDDDDEHIEDVLFGAWDEGPGQVLFSAFHALPQSLRTDRELRLVASTLDELGMDAANEALRTARRNRAKLPRKAPAALVIDGKEISYRWIAKPEQVVKKTLPSVKTKKAPPASVWGTSLARRREVQVSDRLYEDLLDVLGAPSSVETFGPPLGAGAYFFPRWKKARVEAAVSRLGFAVSVLRTGQSDD